jgi:hypothetical protein
MRHKLRAALEVHLASPNTALDNGNNWGLVQIWLLVSTQKDGGNGNWTKSKSFIAFKTDVILTNNDRIHCWINDHLNATLGRHPDPTSASTTVEIQGNMAIVENISGIIANEVGQRLGVAMQNVTRAGPVHAGGAGASEDAKPCTQDQIAILLGFHRAMMLGISRSCGVCSNQQRCPILTTIVCPSKAKMLRWADGQRCGIEEGVYLDNKSLNEGIALKFNPGYSTALYLFGDKGISIVKCCAPTSAHLEELRRQEEIWDATKGNATYVEVIKQARSKDVSPPAHDFGELRLNIRTFCALLFTLFGEGCDLYWLNFEILQILSLPFCMQNKLMFNPEVCRCITWAIIFDTQSFFDGIKLTDDFFEQGCYMQLLASTLEGDYTAIKHGINMKIEHHNLPPEWKMLEPHYECIGGYQQGRGSGGLGWEFQFLVPIPGTPIGSEILILFSIPEIPVGFFFEFRC